MVLILSFLVALSSANAQQAVAICLIKNDSSILRKFMIQRHEKSYTIRFGDNKPVAIQLLGSQNGKTFFRLHRLDGSVGIAIVHQVFKEATDVTLPMHRVVVMRFDKAEKVLSTADGVCQQIGIVPR